MGGFPGMAGSRSGLVSSAGDFAGLMSRGRLTRLLAGLLLMAGLLAGSGYYVPGYGAADGSLPEESPGAAAQLRLSLNPGTPWARPGETVTFAIDARGEASISAVELTLDLGRDLEVVEVKPGPYLGERTIAVPEVIDRENNQVTFAWARIGETPSSIPPGALALVTVKAASGFPWNAWIKAQVRLVDPTLRKFQETTLASRVKVYRRLPWPTLVSPAGATPDTGLNPVFAMKTPGPASFKYRVEISQDGFQSTLRVYDQSISRDGWDRESYSSNQTAVFTAPESLTPGEYQWRASVWVEEAGRWGEPGLPAAFVARPEPTGISRVGPLAITRFHDEEVSRWPAEEEERPASENIRCCKPSPGRLRVGGSIEPNDLLSAPPGLGDAAYVPGGQVIDYTIRFENPATAAATAFDVTIMAQLDSALDPDSLLAGAGSHPELMTVEADAANGEITWFFKGINLPPNREPPEGEGWVGFSANIKADALSGTPVSVKAAIRLDSSQPIETNEVVYTVDSASPSTRVSDLAPVQLTSAFEVPWEGGDDPEGSGLHRVDLLVSRNGEPFEVAGTVSPRGTVPAPFSFRGDPGVTYGLATVGVDRVGHSEEVPTLPDVTVTIGQPFTFEPGLQLLGMPVAPERGPRETLSLPGSGWQSWDPSGQDYFSGPDAEDTWPVAPDGTPGQGLWARFAEPTTAYVTGQPAPPDKLHSIALQTGWNLIANPYAEEVSWSLEAILVRAGDVEKTLGQARESGWMEDFSWGWDGASYFLVYDAGVVPGAVSRLKPLKGYWVLAHQPVVLVLPPLS